MKAVSKHIILLITTSVLLGACSKGSHLHKSAALQSVKPVETVQGSQLGKGVYLVTEDRSKSYGSKARPFVFTMQAANKTIRSGYSHFVLFPYREHDSELRSARANGTVRALYLKRLKKKTKVVDQLSMVGKISRKHFSGANKPKEIRAVLVAFKGRSIGLNARKTKRKIKKWISFLNFES